MRRIMIAFVGLLSALLTLPLTIQAQELPSTRKIATVDVPPILFDTDGSTLVWINGGAGFYDVFVSDLIGGSPRWIATVRGAGLAQPSAIAPAVDRGVAVWVTNGADPSKRDIRATDLATGREFAVAASDVDETHPAISGNRVAYISNVSGSRTIMLAEIGSADEPITIAELPTDWETPKLVFDGDRILWREIGGGRAYTARLRLANVVTGEIRTLDQAGGPSLNYDLQGDLVIYGNMLLDLRSGAKQQLPLNIASSTDGRYVYTASYDDARRAGVARAYDPLTGAIFDLGLANAEPAILARGGAIIWQRGQGGTNKYDIYATARRDVLPSARRPAPAADPNVRYFGETGHSLIFGFKGFWERNGGLPVFGYPLTDEFTQRNADTGQFYTVQYVERQRYEYHPENKDTPYEVLLGRLGVEALQRQGRDWTTFPKAASNAPHYYAATGHAIAPEFWNYWRTHGLELGDRGVSEREALALWGYPVSQPQIETNSSGDTVLTQWFERARFEYHPQNPDPYKVLIGRLAADQIDAYGWKQ